MAATPATCGAAIDVPLPHVYELSFTCAHLSSRRCAQVNHPFFIVACPQKQEIFVYKNLEEI
jgi:hypothetical protein